MVSSVSLSATDVDVRDHATGLTYPSQPADIHSLGAGNLEVPDQQHTPLPSVLMLVYQYLAAAYAGGRRLVPQLNEYALHAAWAPVCRLLAACCSWAGDSEVQTAHLPGSAASQIELVRRPSAATGSPGTARSQHLKKHAAHSPSSPAAGTGSPASTAAAAAGSGQAGSKNGGQPAGASRSRSAAQYGNLLREANTTATDLARGRIEYRVREKGTEQWHRRGAFELRLDIADDFPNTQTQVEKELVALHTFNADCGRPQRSTYIALTDASSFVLYCLEVTNFKSWRKEHGYRALQGAITRSRRFRLNWEDTYTPESPDGLLAVSLMVRAFAPDLSRASLEQVQDAIVKANMLDLADSATSLEKNLDGAMALTLYHRQRSEYLASKRRRIEPAPGGTAGAAPSTTGAAATDALEGFRTSLLPDSETDMLALMVADATLREQLMRGVLQARVAIAEAELQKHRDRLEMCENELP